MSLYDLVADTSSNITGGNMNLAGYDDVDNFPGIYKA